MASQLQQFSIIGYINSKSLFQYNSTHKFMFNVFFFGSTSDFALTLFCNWYPSIRLLRFSLFFNSRAKFVFNTSYFVQRDLFTFDNLLHSNVVEFSLVFIGRHFEKQRAVNLSEQMDHSSLSKLSIVLPPGSFRACEKNFKRRHCQL